MGVYETERSGWVAGLVGVVGMMIDLEGDSTGDFAADFLGDLVDCLAGNLLFG